MLTRRMKTLKDEEGKKRHENASGGQQQQLSEEEQEEIRKEKEAMKQVLHIPLMVEEIIGYLKYPDLKTSRRVSSMWRETATKVMLKKDCSQVKLIYDDGVKKFVRDSGVAKMQRDYLSELIKLFRKSLSKKTTVNKFPSSTFTITFGSLGNPEMLEFFKIAGQQVKKLTLVENQDSTFDSFREILEGHCQNVENLHMSRQKFQLSENNVQFTLPKLRELSMGPYCVCGCSGNRGAVGYAILKTIITPNLEIVKDFNLGQDTNNIVEAGKVHAVKEFCITNYDEKSGSYPGLLQALTNSGPQLESISLMMYGPEHVNREWSNRMTDPLQQLLNACKDTLKKFNFNGLGFLFKDMMLPRFSKLTELEIEELGYVPIRMFPIRINLADTFPKLTTINLSRINFNQDENWDKYFPPPDAYGGELTSVTRVMVSRLCSQNVKDKLQLICPNAEFCIEYTSSFY